MEEEPEQDMDGYLEQHEVVEDEIKDERAQTPVGRTFMPPVRSTGDD